MGIKNVTVFGSGVLGAQIAFQTAYHGYNVTLFDIKQELLEQAKLKFEQFKKLYQQDINAVLADLDAAVSRVNFTTDLAESVKDADLTIEAIPESIQIKKDFYSRLGSPRPLALYYFGNDDESRRKVLSRTTSGNVTINGTFSHIAQDDLPFGGVGDSGMGAYHGIEGFRTLSHAKGIFEQGRWNGMDLFRAPYGGLADKLIRFFLR